MALQDKYASLIQAAQQAGIQNLSVKEQNNVLYIDGEANTGMIKDQLWTLYDKIDPNFRSGDLVMNINVNPSASNQKMTVSTKSSNLNVRKGPGTDQPIIGKAAHGATVIFISKYNDSWYLVRTEDGVEGYCSTDFLTAQ